MILAIQQAIKNIGKTFETLIRVVFMSRFFIRLPKRGVPDECLILGNGPSLRESLNNFEFIAKKELFCVNFFPNTELYQQLQPKFLIITAPELWTENVDQNYLDSSNWLFQNIIEKTNWKLTVMLPSRARRFKRWKMILNNPNIGVKYYNVTPVEGFRFFRHWLFRTNIGIPRPHNVLIPSLMIAINMKYSKVYLLGAEHNWLKEITVDKENQVLINQKHFYDLDTSKAKPMAKLGKGKRKLHEVLLKFYYSFYSYFVIQEYAKTRNVKILNATPGSFIDAFPKIEIKK